MKEELLYASSLMRFLLRRNDKKYLDINFKGKRINDYF
jgi:hypothetical protein